MIEQIELENFKSIKKAVIDIRPVTIFIGPNGSGKSTVAYTLVGMYKPTAGNVSIKGQDLSINGKAN